MADLYILNKLAEVADSSCLQDKMKVVFVQARGADESFITLMCDLCSALRVSIIKSQRLIAKLETLGQRGEALKPLDYMEEMVVRDSAMLGVLEQLLAGTHVGMRLKASYVAEMEETEHNAWDDIPEKFNVFKNSVGYSSCWSRDSVDALQISSALL
ncbi:hypothetical protein Tco_1007073 [Tanacetum coccineum]|uniref:Uncharacterized protein n=1 Tax=Tanacetum coccineum TaxID=301880 RepID=A0ABQ5FKP9_9ASTR